MRVNIGELFIAVIVLLVIGFTSSMVCAEGDNTTSASGFVDTDADDGFSVYVSEMVDEVGGTGNTILRATSYVGQSDSVSSGGILLGRAIGTVTGDIGTPTGAVSEGDRLGFMLGRGYDGSKFHNAAGFTIKVDGTVSPGSVPARFVIETGTTFIDRQERLVVKSNGNVGVGTSSPGAKLHVGGAAGVDGIMFPDGTLQTMATLVGPQGAQGATGPQGAPGPTVTTSAFCFSGIKNNTSCFDICSNVIGGGWNSSVCEAVADNGSCVGNPSGIGALCCVCGP